METKAISTPKVNNLGQRIDRAERGRAQGRNNRAYVSSS